MLGPLISDASVLLQKFSGPDFHVVQLPSLALCQLAQCLDSSMDANEKGHHAVALSLLRQAVEALTIVELGLCDPGFSLPILTAWSEGRKSHGELRRELEDYVWPGYGGGLWGEAWSDYFTNLSKAVQPYAHCSHELLQWNLTPLTEPDENRRFLATVGAYDPVKASRITLLHVLVVWTLGRLVSQGPPEVPTLVPESEVRALGVALTKSEFIYRGDWSVNFWPLMFFRGGAAEALRRG